MATRTHTTTLPGLDLQGGSGEAPRPRQAQAPARFVYDPSPEEIAAMADEQLEEVYGAMLEYDASGGRVTRKLRREIDCRAKASG